WPCGWRRLPHGFDPKLSRSFGERLSTPVRLPFFSPKKQNCVNSLLSSWGEGMSLKKYESTLSVINHRRAQLSSLTDEELRVAASTGSSLAEQFAAVATVCERVLGQRPFDAQILGALAMADGKIAEMQTGEGKTLAATMAVYVLAKPGRGCHVLTANDYL